MDSNNNFETSKTGGGIYKFPLRGFSVLEDGTDQKFVSTVSIDLFGSSISFFLLQSF
jgi:hypothetical protein